MGRLHGAGMSVHLVTGWRCSAKGGGAGRQAPSPAPGRSIAVEADRFWCDAGFDGYRSSMDQDRTPVLETIQQIRQEGTYSFTLPGHRFGRGIDERTASVLSPGAFAADVAAAKSSVSEAEKLYAEAVGARHAVFTTCGSSISIHTTVLTICGPGDKVLVDRNVHKSVVASLILAGTDPVWLPPCWDHERDLAHPASADAVA